MTAPGGGPEGGGATTTDHQTGAADRQVEIAVLAWEWTREMIATAWMPDDRTVVAERLRHLVLTAVNALLAEASATAAGQEVGAGLVAAGFVGPDALGRTVHLLGTRLLHHTGSDSHDPRPQSRLAELLAGIATGFSRAARDRILAEQDAIRNSYLIARQRLGRLHRASPDIGPAPGPGDGDGRPRTAGAGEGTDLIPDLRVAVKRREFVTYYHPVVRLTDQAVVGMHAHPRWHHQTRGVLLPTDFLHAADLAGMLQPLAWLLHTQACSEALSWTRSSGPLFLSIAPHTLGLDATTANTIAAVLDHTGLPPTLLHLRISVDICRPAAFPALRRLADLGVQLALDHSAHRPIDIANLATLPLTHLNLDVRLLHALRDADHGTAQTAAHTIGALNALAHELGLTTTAQGITTRAEADLLRRLHTTYGQGNLYGTPTAGSPRR